MKKTNKSAGVQYKLIFYYALFALLPMFLIAVFTYGNTKKIQLERLYEELSYQMEHTIKNLDEKANNYYAASNMFYMDNTLQSYLTADYSQRGYEDLYSYVDDLFSNVKIFNPDITKISVYTSNRTLPQDEYYFYLLDPENLPDWYQTTGNGGVMHMQNTGNGTISFTRKLNFYESGQYQIFVYMEITEDYLNQMLGLGDEEITMVLLNDAGEIQASNHPELIGKNMASINLEKQIFMKNNTAYCGQLQMFTDSRRYDKEAGLAASRNFLVFFVSSVLALAAIYLYSRSFRNKVDKVRQGAKSIGEGKLDYRIFLSENGRGRDELDEIADSVNQMGEQIHTLIEESYKKELDRKISELNLLQEQINPHFLYNALSSISVLAMGNGDKVASRAILYLSDFYRITLSKGKQDIPIREELNLLESYLKIQRMRFDDSIEVEYELDESLLDVHVVKLTLQPIVENAIHHGRDNDSEVFHILIRLFEEQEKTVFEVIDDGCGMDPEKLMDLQNSMNHSEGGYGLRNVNIRIKLQYGPQYGVYIESERGFGTKIRIEFPGRERAKA
ncbi:sensor histidine kinase [Fusicatenibacter faecihominis]|uniref:Sensor histidine kinase n=1 Tax=Fusicatenibacter faecihominis TaxID=2881276 RepID=A0AAE3J774_9FIRM|nr:sensor histidine kinase [Fusicatenibacter faecihominis]MCC2190783.1 sensor histidine kinase [Fusicatenibacter faecihominis]